MVCKCFPSGLQTSFILSAVPSPRHKLPFLCCPGDRHFLATLCLQHTHQEMNQVMAEVPANPHIPPSQEDREAPLGEGEVRIYLQRQPPSPGRQQGAGPPTLGHPGVTAGQPEHLDLAVTLQEPLQITSGMCFSFKSNKWKHWTQQGQGNVVWKKR